MTVEHVALVGAWLAVLPAGATELGIDGGQFTLNGKPTFLLGVSYYGGLGAPERFVQRDLDDLAARGVNWVRVWATWSCDGVDVSAVAADGQARPEWLARLVGLVDASGARGIVVDVTLSRGSGVGSVHGFEGHLRAVETLAKALKGKGNVYIDLANERNVGDARHVPFDELARMRDAVKAIDPARLVTASQGGDIGDDELRSYVETVRVDFIAPHRGRDAGSPAQTEERTRAYLAKMRELGRVVPAHYQEPFRRDYGRWQPEAGDFLADLQGAVRGGAAGWCLHNGSPRDPHKGPARSFDLRAQRGRLLDQLDAVEREVLDAMARTVREASGPR